MEMYSFGSPINFVFENEVMAITYLSSSEGTCFIMSSTSPWDKTVPLWFNVEMFVFRKCGKSGSWDNFNESFVVIEKTNYESCVQNGATHPQEYSSQYLDELIDAMIT
jgi:hypothetical protein